MPIDVECKPGLVVDTSITWAVDVHPIRPWLLIGDLNSVVTLYNLESGNVIRSFRFYPASVYCVKFISCKNWFVVGSQDGTLSTFDCDTHKEVVAFQAHARAVYCLAIHPTAAIILTGSNDETIKAWDWDKQWDNIQTYKGHTSYIMSIAFNPKEPNTFTSASADGTVKMWSIASPIPIFSIKAHNGSVTCVNFHLGAEKPYLITASSDGTIRVWDYLSRTCVQTLLVGGHIFCAMFHPSLPIIISGNWNSGVRIWDSESYEIEQYLVGYQFGSARCIAFRKDTSEVVIGFDLGVFPLELAQSGPSQMGYTDPYQQCATLAMKLVAAKATTKLISELRGDNAQHVADLLSKMVSDKETFTLRERKHSLHLLSKLAKSAEVFPRSQELEGVKCDLTTFVAAGGYGFIYEGEHEGRAVCVKVVQMGTQGIDRMKLRAHASELTIWAHLDHPNVLPFLGIYLSKDKVPRMCIVSPWMLNGDLRQYLGKVPDVPRKPLVRDIISGLQYLHDLDIIHADLKAKNVLVSETGKAMLADFGISRLSITLTTNVTNVSIGTVYWMAPELHLDDEPSPSRESDIWAFACTCYEIITGKAPYSHYRNPAILIGAFYRGVIIPAKPEKPVIGWDEDIWSIAMRCWKRAPASRPKIHQLLEIINNFNFLDDRPLEPEAERRRNNVQVDYDRIFGILDGVRHSAVGLKDDDVPSTNGDTESLGWLRRGSRKVQKLLQGPLHSKN